VSRCGTPLAQGTGAAEAPAWYHQRPDIHKCLSHKATLSSSRSWAYIRCNTRQPTDFNPSQENVHGRQTTTIFPDKLGKVPLLHKLDKPPRAGRRNAADRMRSRRKNERLLTECACTISGSSLRFIVPVETALPFPMPHAEKPSFTNSTDIAYRSPEDEILWCGVQGAQSPLPGLSWPQRPLLRLQQPAPTEPYSDTFAYTRRNTRQPTDSNTSRENMLSRQTTYLFPDKLGKAPLSHKQDQHPTGRAAFGKDKSRKALLSHKQDKRQRARRYLYRQPDAKQTEKRENRHRKVLALFLRRFSFYCARGNSSSVPQASCGNTYFYKPNRHRIPGPGRNSLVRGTGGAEPPAWFKLAAEAPAYLL